MINKQWSNEFNPFNWNKFFAHVYRWKEIGKSPAPAPVQIGIDPSNVCQLDCEWCNSNYIRNANPKLFNKDTMMEIADFAPKFTDHPIYGGAESVCIAGGGEPLTNPATQDFIDRVRYNGLKPVLITNGINLHKFDLGNCDWAGVSVDAGTRETYKNLKRGDHFDKVIDNIKGLVETKGIISKIGKGHGVSYKFIMYPGNVGDIYEATKIAREIGCRNIHIRPYAPSFQTEESQTSFTQKDIELFRDQLTKSQELETDTFSVYGVTHKFNGLFIGKNDFEKCHAVLFASHFEPPTTEGDGLFNVTVCCDRRGDPKLTQENTTIEKFRKYWGSPEHMSLVDKIDPKKCDRCIRTPHNKIYENAISNDNMSYEFG